MFDKAFCTVVLLVLCMIYRATPRSLPCSSCALTNCGPAPTNCELDKIPCGCCFVCARQADESCEPFSPRCATGLKCLTPAGLYDGRPPWYQPYFKGVCVVDPGLQLIPTTASPWFVYIFMKSNVVSYISELHILMFIIYILNCTKTEFPSELYSIALYCWGIHFWFS